MVAALSLLSVCCLRLVVGLLWALQKGAFWVLGARLRWALLVGELADLVA